MTQKWSKWPIGNSDNTCSPLVRPLGPVHSSGHSSGQLVRPHWSLLASSTHTTLISLWYEIENIASQRSPKITRLKIMWRCGALLSRVTGVPARNSNVTPKVYDSDYEIVFDFIIWVSKVESVFPMIVVSAPGGTRRPSERRVPLYNITLWTIIRSSHFWFRIILLMFIYDPS